MTILTYIGIALLCLGYIGIICVSLSSKTEQGQKNKQSMSEAKSSANNQPQKHPSGFTPTGTRG